MRPRDGAIDAIASAGGTTPFSASFSIVSFSMRVLRILYQMSSTMISSGVEEHAAAR